MVGRCDLCAALALALATWAAVPPAGIARADAPRDPQLADPQQSDAQLCDVTFVDAERGWAVGDRGVIWHTADSGRRWTLQASGVDCRLTAVRFLDERHGFAVGGRVKPYSQTTAGVLLETRDGGEHWQQDRKLLLPALRDLRFFDARRGCAVGERSALFPTGVFTTDDGGRSWSALAADNGQCWLAGDFSAPSSGVVVGRCGARWARCAGGRSSRARPMSPARPCTVFGWLARRGLARRRRWAGAPFGRWWRDVAAAAGRAARASPVDRLSGPGGAQGALLAGRQSRDAGFSFGRRGAFLASSADGSAAADPGSDVH